MLIYGIEFGTKQSVKASIEGLKFKHGKFHIKHKDGQRGNLQHGPWLVNIISGIRVIIYTGTLICNVLGARVGMVFSMCRNTSEDKDFKFYSFG